jgi:hypothetical protein
MLDGLVADDHFYPEQALLRRSHPNLGLQLSAVDVIRELLATTAAVRKLAARAISIDETQQLLDNRYLIVRNRGGGRSREQTIARRPNVDRSRGAHPRTEHLADHHSLGGNRSRA